MWPPSFLMKTWMMYMLFPYMWQSFFSYCTQDFLIVFGFQLFDYNVWISVLSYLGLLGSLNPPINDFQQVWEVFKNYYFKLLFTSFSLFSLSGLEFIYVRILSVVIRVFMSLFIFLQSFFSVLFSKDNFYYPTLKFMNFSFCHLTSTLKLICHLVKLFNS